MNHAVKNGDCCGAAVAETSENLPTFQPNVDIVRTENEAFIHADLPGVEPRAIEVRFERGVLELRGKLAARPSGRKPLREEYALGNFARSFTLSDEFDGAGTTADYTDGVLTLRIPLAERARSRKIEVRAGQG